LSCFEDADSKPGEGLQAASASPASARRKLADNIASLYLLQGLTYVIPLAVLPYLVRVLGMERYGLLAFAQSFAQYFTTLTDYGFNFSATRSIAQQREDSLAVSRMFSAVLVVKILLMALGLTILAAIVTLIPRFHTDAAFFYVGYIAVAGNVLFPVWYYQGIQRMRYISVVSGVARILAAAALFVFVHRPQDALLALAIQGGGLLLSGVVGLAVVLVHFRLRLTMPSLRELRSALVDGWHLFISTAAVGLYTNTNVFLVGMLSGNVEAGYFSAAEKLIRAMQGLINPISQAIFPHVNTLVKESRELALRFTRRTLRLLAPMTFFPSVAVLILAAPVAHLLFGHNGAGSVPVIRWIALLPFIIAISNVLGVQTMLPFGLDKPFSRILIAGGIFNVLLAVPLVKLFGAQGAGAAVLATESLVTISMAIALKRHGISLFRREQRA
jgi:polysaccharide transporter, PST family